MLVLTNDLILIVDDDPVMRASISAILELDAYRVDEAVRATDMYNILERKKVSLILLDITLQEGEDGLSILKNMPSKYDVPVVLLTGKGDIIDKVVGLELGADDYITKPFHARELLARIKMVLRRNACNSVITQQQNATALLSFHGWNLDVYARTLINPQGDDVKITTYEFVVLHALIQAKGRTLSRDQLLSELSSGGREWYPLDRSLDVLIAKIRKKLGCNPKAPKFIRTVRQKGYMFITDVSVTASV